MLYDFFVCPRCGGVLKLAGGLWLVFTGIFLHKNKHEWKEHTCSRNPKGRRGRF